MEKIRSPSPRRVPPDRQTAGRQRFQEELSVLLGGMWKDTAARERVAATIYGGMLPEWWRDEMVN